MILLTPRADGGWQGSPVTAGVDEPAIAAVDERVEQLIEEAVQFATASPNPSLADFLAEVAAS